MPSLRTRHFYQNIVLATAEDAIADASVSLAAASTEIDAATDNLEALAVGDLDLTAIKVNGQRFVNNGGILELEP